MRLALFASAAVGLFGYVCHRWLADAAFRFALIALGPLGRDAEDARNDLAQQASPCRQTLGRFVR